MRIKSKNKQVPVKDYQIGDLVWAKLKGYAPWPSRVCTPPPDYPEKGKPIKKTRICVMFFGTNDFAMVDRSDVKDYETFKERLMKTSKSQAFKEACEAAEVYNSRKAAGMDMDEDSPYMDLQQVEIEMKIGTAEGQKEMNGGGGSNVNGNNNMPETAENGEGEEESDDVDSNEEEVEEKSQSTTATSTHSQTSEKRKIAEDDDASAEASTAPSPKKRKTVGARFRKFRSKLTVRKRKPVAGTSRSQFGKFPNQGAKNVGAVSFSQPSVSSSSSEMPKASITVESVNQYVRNVKEKITPSPLTLGFLGLGAMGKRIVKKLISTGHSVVVWNRTPETCNELVAAGAERGLTPSEVVSAADITFSCVSDAQACKNIIFDSSSGVINTINAGKSYVEMTGMDPETSKDLEEAITSNGGRYLEAQLQGGMQEAEDGQLVILCAGDRSLYDDCISVFASIGKTSFFYGAAGRAAKLNLVLQLMAGVMISGLSEAMSLASRIGLEMEELMTVLALTKMACPLVMEKASLGMNLGPSAVQVSVQHMQKDLNLALAIGNALQQPLPTAATANEAFKNARRLGLTDLDFAALLQSRVST